MMHKPFSFQQSAGVEYTLFFGAEYEVLDENVGGDDPDDNKYEVGGKHDGYYHDFNYGLFLF